ncbi:exopolysaccharide/PEP-CTERM locus tyrosine autokinase [Blastomonas natatoria]|uniref:Exopolysaccharide/PEP-CTERM locus tyrosine autokinase n=1 Tax=Blastomonas natatoria TaxID=34015 RepID=A0A2V3VC94_9SPHN|nr:AAA family ATPase [Blastomonas natatoria]PXW78471.1 exopolysaccharide/PEP-CTERM locus tyrosine autokinase [Blastomonas natatoria]
MTMHDPIKSPDKSEGSPSLIERASQMYDFRKALSPDAPKLPEQGNDPAPAPIETPSVMASLDPVAPAAVPAAAPAPAPVRPRAPVLPVAEIDRDLLRESAFIVPDGPVTSISEEFRIVKRRLLASVQAEANAGIGIAAQRILICSANPGDGKTYSAINLAISIAAEKDHDVLLVDADFAKPSVLSSLGIAGQQGFMDALADPAVAVEDLIIPTDIPGLSVLPAGRQTNTDSEYLASARTREVLASLTAGRPGRIVIFDSPPLLAASPAATLAQHVGHALMVVRADVTSERALRDALSLIAGCNQIQLLLNGVKFSPSGRSFGSYYGYGE